jgi:excisionase family DNA binding protein
MNDAELKEQLDRIESLTRLSAKEVLDINEAALLTGYSVNYLHSLTSGKKIPHYKQGNFLRFRKSELENWLLAIRVPTRDETESEAEAICHRLNNLRTNRKAAL